jgi:phosphoserine phosphatase RsbU/P
MQSMSATSRSTTSTSPFELQPLVEFTRTINSSFDIDFILNNILFTLMGKLRFTRGMIFLREEQNTFRVAKVKGIREIKENEKVVISPASITEVSVDSLDEEKFPWLTQLQQMGISHIQDLTVQNKLIGIVCLGKRIGDNTFTASEEIFFRSLVNISATAIQKTAILEELKEANRNLDYRIQELNTLFELSKEFSSVIRHDQVVKVLVFSLLGHLGTNRYLICVDNNGQCEVIASRLPVKEVKPEVLRDLMKCTKPEIITEATGKFEPETFRCLYDYDINLVVPMTRQGITKGVMLLGKRMTAVPYTQNDFEFLSSLGNLAMTSIENIQLFEEMLEKQRLEEELKIAHEIQQGLLPKTLPKIPRYQIAACTLASKQVGGDYYDVVQLDDYRYLLVIADVSGKGTPAALLMANLQATIRAIAPLDITIADATSRVNDLIYDNTSADKFITFFWAILDVKENTLKYVNAGHNPPYFIKTDGSITRLEKGGMILGVLRSVTKYEHDIISIEPGDLFVMFTDGISEAMNRQLEEYGEERLEELIRAKSTDTAKEILDSIVNSVQNYADPTNQSDDITALIMKAT